MNFTCLLLVNLYLCCWMLFYYIAFSRKTSFKLNRTILLAGLVFSFLLPFISVPSLPVFSASSTPVVTISKGTGRVLSSPAAGTRFTFPVWETLVCIYWSGAVLTALGFLWKLIQIRRYIRKFPHASQKGFVHVITPGHWEVFSFLHYLFAPENVSTSILEHEKVHIRQRHSLDNLLTETVKIFCWFNPAIYVFQKTLKMNHEYLADASTIKIVDVTEYAQRLVNQSFKLSNLSLVHPFLNRSHLQKRLIMLQQKGKPAKGRWAYLLLLPAMTGITLFTSSFSLKSKLHDAIEKIKPAEAEGLSNGRPILKDTTIEGTLHTPSGEPVAGANIIIGTTQRGTITNDEGHFKLKDVATGAILQISSIGYNSIILQVPPEKNNLDIILYPKPESLNQLNVTGYTGKSVPPPPPPPSPKPSKDDVLTFVEQMPSFPGGQAALMKYLHDNIKYPANARENAIRGTIVVQFVVEEDGSITHIRTIGRKKGGGLEQEAMRVVKKMPNWNPGKQNGKSVRVQYSLPIRFMLQ